MDVPEETSKLRVGYVHVQISCGCIRRCSTTVMDFDFCSDEYGTVLKSCVNASDPITYGRHGVS